MNLVHRQHKPFDGESVVQVNLLQLSLNAFSRRLLMSSPSTFAAAVPQVKFVFGTRDRQRQDPHAVCKVWGHHDERTTIPRGV